MRGIRGRLVLAMVAIAVLTAVVALPVTIAYFERRLPPETAAAVERDLRGGELDGAAELLLLVLVTAGVGAALGVLVARRLAQPVSALSVAAQLVARGELSARPQVSASSLRSADEMGGLLRDFTAMAQSLEDLERERQGGAAALAHELRTPLTVLQSRLEAARDHLLRVDDDEIGVLLAQTRTLARLVDDLRTVSLADAGRLTLHPARVDLLALAAGVVAGFQVLAAEAGVALPAPGGAPVDVDVDVDRMGQVLANLLSNGLRHAGAGGHVQVDVGAREGWAELTVSDDGPGFPPGLLDSAFTRFSRGDAARTRSRDGGGSGLGLAVVESVVHVHAGTVTAADAPGGGGCVVVRLPLPVHG